MHQAFIQDTENDVNRQQGCQNQHGLGAQDCWYANSVPAKKPCSEEGVPSRFCICVMLEVASLNDTPGARLKETVTDGNKPVWLIDKGVVLAWPLATASSGMFLPLEVSR